MTTLTESYITLINKDKDNKHLLKNYRPISLLNVDYKILAKVLVGKLKPHMPALVHEDQQCSVQSRNLRRHAHGLRDIIAYKHDKHVGASILSLDQEKAFDRVSHSHLHNTLLHCNMGENYRRWIAILYAKPTSRVLVNHNQSNPIQLTRSGRQSCPLSPSSMC
jgi:hypothetical protein